MVPPPTTRKRPLSLFFCLALTLVSPSDGKWGNSFWMEDLQDAYFDMGFGRGLDITKSEWQVERAVTDSKKGPRLDGICTVRFLTGDDELASGNVALFSTGEVGTWNVVKPADRQASESGATGLTASVAHVSYDDAVVASSSCLEIDVPSMQREDRSVVSYTFPMGSGSVQPLALVVKTQGSVRYYPTGRGTSSGLLDVGGSGEDYNFDDLAGSLGSSSGDAPVVDDGIEVGTASLHLKGGKPLVDPAWAKGRRWFWTKREQGGMGSPGYI